MNEYVEKTRLLAREIVSKSKYVSIDENAIKEFCKYFVLKKFGIGTGPHQQIIESDKDKFTFEVFTNAINYCFWYGRHDIRPFGITSSQLYSVSTQAFFQHKTEQTNFPTKLKTLIRDKRFTMIEERCNHIDEIMFWNKSALNILNVDDPSILFESMVKNTSCYGSDLFLKRAQLVFIQMFRRFGMYEDFCKELTVPADYHIPKSLYSKGILVYDKELEEKIKNHVLIPKGSIEEIEIRASTIIACDMISNIVGIFPYEIDSYLFNMSRDLYYDTPFHLTITTDY